MHKMFSILLGLALLFLVVGCAQSSENDSSSSSPAEASSDIPTKKKMVVYQMMTRLFGNKSAVNNKYGTRNENGVGKFADIDERALTYLTEMGITHVWYTGVLEHATMTDYSEHGIALDDADVVKGRAGSPYAIKDYYDVNPDLATDVPNRMGEFEGLLKRTHDAGLKVVIDFVPNHVARSYASDAKPAGVKDLGESDDNTVSYAVNNNFYYLPGEAFQVPTEHTPIGEDKGPGEDQSYQENPAKVTGNNVFSASPNNGDWFETCKLNYGVDIQQDNTTHFDPIPDTWVKMKDILVFWTEKGVDGFRCDMAEMVPVEFWGWAIPQVQTVNPDIVFIAEIYNPAEYHNYVNTGKFDYLYDKVGLYDEVRRLMGGEGNVNDFGEKIKQFEGIEDTRWVFLENHDEQRIGSEEFKGSVETGLAAFALCAAMGKGPAMIYFGQEVGEPGQGEEGFQGADGRTTIFDYWGVPNHQANMNGGAFDGGGLTDAQKQLKNGYQQLLLLLNSNEAFSDGTANVIAGPQENMIMVHRKSEHAEVLVVTHFGDTPSLNPFNKSIFNSSTDDQNSPFSYNLLFGAGKAVEEENAKDPGFIQVTFEGEGPQTLIFEVVRN